MKQNKITRSARDKPCTARIPGAGNHDPKTTVLGHAPFSGKFGSRLHWWWSAFVCSDCHDILDGRSDHVKLTMREKDLIWFAAVHETQEYFIEEGLLKVVL